MFSLRVDRYNRLVLDIKTKSYQTSLFCLEKGLFYEERELHRSKDSVETYAFGPQWSLHVGTFEPDTFFLDSGQGYVDMSQYDSVFLPSFSAFRIKMRKGIYRFRCYVSDIELPPFLPKTPAVIHSGTKKPPDSFSEILTWIANASSIKPLLMDLYAPGVVRRLKHRLDKNFDREVRLEAVAPDLLSISKVRRRFREVYGMTPVAYRNKLRVFSSLWLLMVKNFSVTSAGQEVGFHNRAGYIRQFKREVKEVPSAFHLH